MANETGSQDYKHSMLIEDFQVADDQTRAKEISKMQAHGEQHLETNRTQKYLSEGVASMREYPPKEGGLEPFFVSRKVVEGPKLITKLEGEILKDGQLFQRIALSKPDNFTYIGTIEEKDENGKMVKRDLEPREARKLWDQYYENTETTKPAKYPEETEESSYHGMDHLINKAQGERKSNEIS
jgi:hypothetical protein